MRNIEYQMHPWLLFFYETQLGCLQFSSDETQYPIISASAKIKPTIRASYVGKVWPVRSSDATLEWKSPSELGDSTTYFCGRWFFQVILVDSTTPSSLRASNNHLQLCWPTKWVPLSHDDFEIQSLAGNVNTYPFTGVCAILSGPVFLMYIKKTGFARNRFFKM